MLKVKSAIACEYIAQGINDKVTLVNVFSGGIFVQDFPVSIPLAFYIEIIPKITINTNTAIVLYDTEGTKKSFFYRLKLSENEISTIVIPQMFLEIKKESKINIELITNEGKSIDIFYLSINKKFENHLSNAIKV